MQITRELCKTLVKTFVEDIANDPEQAANFKAKFDALGPASRARASFKLGKLSTAGYPENVRKAQLTDLAVKADTPFEVSDLLASRRSAINAFTYGVGSKAYLMNSLGPLNDKIGVGSKAHLMNSLGSLNDKIRVARKEGEETDKQITRVQSRTEHPAAGAAKNAFKAAIGSFEGKPLPADISTLLDRFEVGSTVPVNPSSGKKPNVVTKGKDRPYGNLVRQGGPAQDDSEDIMDVGQQVSDDLDSIGGSRTKHTVVAKRNRSLDYTEMPSGEPVLSTPSDKRPKLPKNVGAKSDLIDDEEDRALTHPHLV